ncbi:MAG: class I SAM-dependent methyltransferase [Chloroflexota bacterium]
MINHSNLEDYVEPVLYDYEVRDFEPDGPFYQHLASQRSEPILDLGCGTGRVTIPLAQAGLDITGLDIVPEMLARARRKAGDLPIRWVEADMRSFNLGETYGLIIASGMPFEHLLTREDQEAALSCIWNHLDDEGLFAISIRVPTPDLMKNSDGEQFWYSYMTDERGEVRLSGEDTYDVINQIRHETAYRRWIGSNGEEITKRARLALRLIFPQEMESLLVYNRFEILHRYGDWEFLPPKNESGALIYVCRKREQSC